MAALPLPRFITARVITALVMREMGSTYGKSPGGYAWAILEPVAGILFLSLAFSLVVRAPSLGTSFILFYATGVVPFQLYQDLTSKLTQSMRYSKSLLAYPRVTWIDALAARGVLSIITSITVFCILMTSIIMLIDESVELDVVHIVEGLLVAIISGLAIGTTNCLLSGLYPLWQNIWSIINRPLFIASGVLFIMDDLPRLAQQILWWNPLIHATGLVRKGFYPMYEASYVSLAYALAVPLTIFAISLFFLGRYYTETMEN
ncbi:ABC transporter permease [Marivivens donghaensis]|uniref:Transport permease protein n=1 Tax=Marivivens donghaensis TaxID=1699413 RepID=A0ABX0W3L7_9RHOB|nr:ABC transporter permease [Marivivens donghaensis]NIY73839.1 ABC transporter permease [Marivivens donghaensis]